MRCDILDGHACEGQATHRVLFTDIRRKVYGRYACFPCIMEWLKPTLGHRTFQEVTYRLLSEERTARLAEEFNLPELKEVVVASDEKKPGYLGPETGMKIKILDEVLKEWEQARGLHKPMNSAHEAYGIILEELEKFWIEVRRKQAVRHSVQMKHELIQIAAIACRTIQDLGL